MNRQLYTLYYAVRVCLLLDGELGRPWKGYLRKLVEKQIETGDAAGMFPQDVGRWVRTPVVATALAALTLEHALYER